MNTEQERTEFEAWYRLHHGSRDVYGRDASGEYADKQVQGAFNVWQARAALTAQPAAATKAPGDEGASMNTSNDWFPMWEITGFDMTLRDYFAAKAMQGFITNLDTGEKRLIDVPQLAKSAYSIADAMLKAREVSDD